MTYLVTTRQGYPEGIYESLKDAIAKRDATGGDVWVDYDSYVMDVHYPEYRLVQWAEYLWRKLCARPGS